MTRYAKQYAENYKILLKKLKTRICGERCYSHGLEHSILLRCKLSQINPWIQCNPNQNSSRIFRAEINKLILKSVG